jgi:serum/glucocorticoid-regulated kinase 2
MQFRDKRLGCTSLSMGLPDGQTEVTNVAVSAYMAMDPVFDFLNTAQKAISNGEKSASKGVVPAFTVRFAKKCKIADPTQATIKVNPEQGEPEEVEDVPPTTPRKSFFSSIFGSSTKASPSSSSSRNSASNKPLNIDDFDLIKIVGKGAFGKVLLVKKKVGAGTNQIYAMKVLKKTDVIDKGQVEHTNAEQAILREIKHPFVVGLRFSFQNHDKLYLITDYYSGGNLFHHLRKSTTFTEERAKFYTAELCLALDHLHSKDIIYRDLKLENILMDHTGHIILTDFGLSKPDIDKTGGASTFCGTAEYIAPELLMGKTYREAVDWWSFGILLYEMMNGSTPFYNKNKKLMYYNITHNPPSFDEEKFGENAQNVIRALLNVDEGARLGSNGGAKEIFSLDFYNKIDQAALYAKKIRPPFIPEGNEKATNYVSKSLAKLDIKEAVMPGPREMSPDKQREMDTLFKGFTYQES